MPPRPLGVTSGTSSGLGANSRLQDISVKGSGRRHPRPRVQETAAGLRLAVRVREFDALARLSTV